MLTKEQKEYAALTAELVGAEVAAQFASHLLPDTPISNLAEEAAEAASAGLPINSTSLALESSRVVKAGAGTLYGIGGYSNKASAQWVQVFDASALPADGAIPVYIVNVLATGNYGVYWGDTGRFFERGIVLCNSSTAGTKTIGSADTWFDAQYL